MDIKLEFLMGPDATISAVLVEENKPVKAGEELLQYEAAKGILPLLAPEDGVIEAVLVAPGARITQEDVLFRLRTEGPETEPEKEHSAGSESFTSERTDLLVIGAGPGGYEAAIYAAQNNLKVVLVEAAAVGGTCLNEGCIPTKALNKAARTYQDIGKADVMGIVVAEPEIQMARLIDWKDEVKETLVEGILGLLKIHGVKLITGTACFQSAQTVWVQGERGNVEITAEKIIIATGSRSAMLNIPGAGLSQVIDSKVALSLKELPATVTIIGGGVIGMEFAFIYNSLGASVQVIEYLDSILPMLDADVSGRLRDLAEKKGIRIQTGAKVKRIEQTLNQEALVVYEINGQEAYAVSEKVLMAVGRVPDFEDLNLEAAGIKLRDDSPGIKTNEYLQTNCQDIYAIGDVNNRIQLAHAASHHGITAVKHILGQTDQGSLELVPNVIFTIPEIAAVGKTEAECRQEKISYEVFKFPFSGNGKALILGDTDGFVKLLKNQQTDEIIGGSIIGPDASALVNTMTAMIHFKITQEQAAKMIFPHPTTAEAIMESILGLGIGAIHATNKKEVFIYEVNS